ncbi:ACP S-malonyltransferase [Candidatus Pseudothioglobus singularis]|uniref:Malonyl CoA-acyl carrier protein transacylase n=1 Tax=Candidatus Pseudothioglobus singularis PS1 TaxID=1125411 RepID=A0A0M4LG86_9GAMM|nr:ACP S-malonyltransferase [Candidatus Pseudothioglobus singularis]ALE02330.1 malonyl CoA-ACP transacylase [Candidatus Pseudothioglobus singularis PS1]
MKYSIVFPGQGSQSLGMLSDLNSNFSVVNEVFQEASDSISVDLWKIINNDQEALNLTENTQPIMLAAGYATYKVLSEEISLTTVSMAGHSLGEYTALVASNTMSFYDAIQLVRKRGELMQAAVPNGTGSMAAILGLEDKVIVEICQKASNRGIVEAVNFNSPGQVVIAGEKNAVSHACKLMKDVGAKRALVLPVSVPSHCSLMKDAAAEFKTYIDHVDFKDGNVKVIHNVDANFGSDIENIKDKLVDQLYMPVLWTDSVKKMKGSGVKRLIESGPGKVLTGLTRRIDKSLSASAIIDVSSLKSTIEEISNA